MSFLIQPFGYIFIVKMNSLWIVLPIGAIFQKANANRSLVMRRRQRGKSGERFLEITPPNTSTPLLAKSFSAKEQNAMRVVMALFSLPNYRGRVLSIVFNSAIRYLLKTRNFGFLVRKQIIQCYNLVHPRCVAGLLQPLRGHDGEENRFPCLLGGHERFDFARFHKRI